MTENILFELFNASLQEIKAIDDLATIYNMRNTQEFLDWQDELNKYSYDKSPDRKV